MDKNIGEEKWKDDLQYLEELKRKKEGMSLTKLLKFRPVKFRNLFTRVAEHFDYEPFLEDIGEGKIEKWENVTDILQVESKKKPQGKIKKRTK